MRRDYSNWRLETPIQTKYYKYTKPEEQKDKGQKLNKFKTTVHTNPLIEEDSKCWLDGVYEGSWNETSKLINDLLLDQLYGYILSERYRPYRPELNTAYNPPMFTLTSASYPIRQPTLITGTTEGINPCLETYLNDG